MARITIRGTDGHDTLSGAYKTIVEDTFRILGLDGIDRITAGPGANFYDGGDGNDTMFGSETTAPTQSWISGSEWIRLI